MTKYEKRIYEIINQSSSHMTAEQIYQILKADFPGVVLATVYNNLNKLYRDRLINKISVEGMSERYDRIVKHDHIVCQSCGKLTDIQLEDLTETLKKQVGTDFLFYDLKVFHVCPECRKKLGKDKNIR
ncbi:MAG: Fur family transcriptional regulator [Clostridia bacterium]